MEQKKYRASCPICGHNLFKGLPNSYMEGNCPKCRSFRQIYFNGDGVRVAAGIHEKTVNEESMQKNA